MEYMNVLRVPKNGVYQDWNF